MSDIMMIPWRSVEEIYLQMLQAVFAWPVELKRPDLYSFQQEVVHQFPIYGQIEFVVIGLKL